MDNRNGKTWDMGVKVTDGSACHVRFEIREWVIGLARSEITIFQTPSGTRHASLFIMGLNDDDDDFLAQFEISTPVSRRRVKTERIKTPCFSESTTKPGKL